jgi:hypothetical protein
MLAAAHAVDERLTLFESRLETQVLGTGGGKLSDDTAGDIAECFGIAKGFVDGRIVSLLFALLPRLPHAFHSGLMSARQPGTRKRTDGDGLNSNSCSLIHNDLLCCCRSYRDLSWI